jgi:antitoxin CptB
MSDSLDARRKRLLYRSRYRGTKEADHLIGTFADSHVASLPEHELDQLEILLELPDPDLVDWATRRRPVPPEHDSDVMRRLISFNETQKTVI